MVLYMLNNFGLYCVGLFNLIFILSRPPVGNVCLCVCVFLWSAGVYMCDDHYGK